MSLEYLIPRKHTLKILCISKHFSRKYKRTREWVFFSEHSVCSSSAYDILTGVQSLSRRRERFPYGVGGFAPYGDWRLTRYSADARVNGASAVRWLSLAVSILSRILPTRINALCSIDAITRKPCCRRETARCRA